MRKLAVLLVLLLQLTAAHAVNLVINPSFELDTGGAPGIGSLFGWQQFGVTSSDGVVLGSGEPIGFSPDGLYHAFFGNSTTGSGIFQDLATNIGQNYDISFVLHSGFVDPQIGDGVRTVLVEFGGVPIFSQTNPGLGSGFQTFSFTQMATATTTQLRLTFIHQPDFWRIDNILVEDGAPELSRQGLSLAFACIGLVLLTAQRRRVGV